MIRIAGPAVLLAAACVALLAALAIGGAANPQLLQDPGPVVRYGLPVTSMLVNIAAAGVLGSLVMALFVLRNDKPEFTRTLDIAAGSAAVMTVASAATGFFAFLQITGTAIRFDESYGELLGQFLTQVETGKAWLATTLIAAAVTVLCFAVRNLTALVFVGLLAVFMLVPMAQQGHAAGASGHDAAIIALGLHLVFAAVWLGGLGLIAVLSPQLDNARLLPTVSRYSSVALVCFIVVAASGYVSAELRVGSLDRLLTPYGILVLIKVGALIALGLFGAVYRRSIIGKLADSGRRYFFWKLVVVELAFMGIATGVAAALGRTAPPISEEILADRTPAQILTGEVVPPELTFGRFFTSWNFDLLWLLLCAFGIFFYLAGVVRLRRRGDNWPIHRPILWVAGMLLLFFITNGGINVYEKYLFSTHMLGHMSLSMMVPLLLVPGAPVTLAMRAIAKRTDGTRGGREWILLAVHSRFASFISRPVVAGAMFAISLVAFYYTPLFRWSTTDHLGHEWMIVHFLIIGYLFVQALIGIDPVPHRISYPMRLLLLLATMAFHAFFGLSLMEGSGLLLADWYGAMGRDWGVSAIEDQQIGGGVAWSVGEIPTVILAIAVAIQWSRADKKETKRRDRNADRTNEAELGEYNAMLQKLNDRR